MRTVSLSQPVSGRDRSITLRVPGAAVCARIAEVVDGEGHIPADEIPRFASRLSGVSEGKICRLPLIDRTAIRHAVEGLYMEERRRQSARKASNGAAMEGAKQ